MLAKKVGFAISPSQANEALFCAKENRERFKTVFTDEEMKRLVKWFYDNRPMLRKANVNYKCIKIFKKTIKNFLSLILLMRWDKLQKKLINCNLFNSFLKILNYILIIYSEVFT